MSAGIEARRLGTPGAVGQRRDRDSCGWRSASGAKLGAIRCGLVWTAEDTGGIESLSFRAVWTVVDARGRRLEILGSGGFGWHATLTAIHR